MSNEHDGDTPLVCAARQGMEYLVEKLITHGADVNVRDRKGETPLMLSCRHGELNTVEPLVEKGADINASSLEGSTALMEVCSRSSFYHFDVDHMAKFLIDSGADVNAQDSEGESALMKAIHRGNDRIVKMLLEISDINLEDAYGRTALSWSLEEAYDDDDYLLEELVELGANIDVEDGYRETVVVGAYRKRFFKFSLLLLRLNRDQPARIMKKLLCIKEKQDKKEEESVSMECDDEALSSDSEY